MRITADGIAIHFVPDVRGGAPVAAPADTR
jgi:hypothetical protein